MESVIDNLTRAAPSSRAVTALLAALLLASSPAADAQNSHPILRSVIPVAVQAGQTSIVEVTSSNDVRDASGVLISEAGVTAEIIPPDVPSTTTEKPQEITRLKLRLTASADALAGPYDLRLLHPRGPSTLVRFVVVRDPVVVEEAKNNSPDMAQPVTAPVVVCGQIEEKLDIDRYQFHAEAGAGLVFHVIGQRLQHSVHDLRGRAQIDPILTLRNAAGITLATADNTSTTSDPLLHHRFEEAGEYVLEVRDVRYQGWGDYWPYAIEINTRPFVTAVHPLAIAPGIETSLLLAGWQLPAGAIGSLTLPVETRPGVRLVQPLVAGQLGNSTEIVVCPSVPRIEPDGENDTAAAAIPLSLPTVISGRIERVGDLDCYAFDAKAGETFSFEVIARRAGSHLDAGLRILDAAGSPLTEVDDFKINLFTIADAQLEGWSAPSDGRYIVEIRDVLAAGGPEYPYVLSVTRSQPHFVLDLNSDKTPLAPGVSGPIFVRVERRNGFTGAVQLAIDGLPAGVSALCGQIPPERADGCIVLQAAMDAPQGAANIQITGTAAHPQDDGAMLALSAVARPLCEVAQDGGGRGLVPVRSHTVAVSQKFDVESVTLSMPEIRIPPGGAQRVDVTIVRAPDFRENVTLDLLFQHLGVFADPLPKGVTIDAAASQTILAGDATQGHITLKAASDAPPVKEHLLAVMAQTVVDFSTRITTCQPLRLSVVPAAP